MNNDTLKIKCPHCGEEISVQDALSHQVKKTISEQAKEEAKKELSQEIKYLQEENEKKEKELEQTKKIELELRKEKNQLSEDKKNFELEKQRQLDKERELIRIKAIEEQSEKDRYKFSELEKKLTDTKKALEEANRKASQPSQQLQGEVQELNLERELHDLFPTDIIEEIKKGERGADIRQTVKTPKGNLCGVILWESKRTKAWKDEFISKLKEDLRSANANIPIIVTTVMPKESKNNIYQRDGVWICTSAFAMILGQLVRQRLVEVAREKFIIKNKGTKAEDLYSYIMGHEFRQQIEAIIETYMSLKSELIREKNAFERIWKDREEQTEKLIKSTARIVGSISGKAGSEFPQLKGLDLLESGK